MGVRRATACVMQVSYRDVEIELRGTTTTGVLMPIGTEHPFTHRFGIATYLFLANVAMGNELTRLLAMRALHMVQLPGLLLNGC